MKKLMKHLGICDAVLGITAVLFAIRFFADGQYLLIMMNFMLVIFGAGIATIVLGVIYRNYEKAKHTLSIGIIITYTGAFACLLTQYPLVSKAVIITIFAAFIAFSIFNIVLKVTYNKDISELEYDIKQKLQRQQKQQEQQDDEPVPASADDK